MKILTLSLSSIFWRKKIQQDSARRFIAVSTKYLNWKTNCQLQDGTKLSLSQHQLQELQRCFTMEKYFHQIHFGSFFRKSITNPESIEDRDFLRILEIPMVGVAKATQCLFLVQPNTFIPADSTLPKSLAEMQGNLKGENGWSTYLKIIEKLKQLFPGCGLYEVSRALYLFSDRFSDKTPKFYSVTTSIPHKRGILWDEFSENGTVHVNSFKNRGKLLNAMTRVDPGDVVLARDGVTQACGLGVVEKRLFKRFT